MKISFDLDDTLILSGDEGACEPPLKLAYSLFCKEKLRKGTITLCRELHHLGIDIGVYTTSERSVPYIRRLFKAYGIELCLVVNQDIHQKLVQGNKMEIQPSKYPPRFGFQMHVDDDESVRQNGQQYGFRVLVVDRNDPEWGQKVLDEAVRVKRLLAP